MATYTISHPGNIAIQQEVWTMTLAEARAAATLLTTHVGSYWHENLVKPTNRAKRQKQATVRVYTAGFSTSELSNALFNCDMPVEQQG